MTLGMVLNGVFWMLFYGGVVLYVAFRAPVMPVGRVNRLVLFLLFVLLPPVSWGVCVYRLSVGWSEDESVRIGLTALVVLVLFGGWEAFGSMYATDRGGGTLLLLLGYLYVVPGIQIARYVGGKYFRR